MNILITISCICMLFIIGRIFIMPIKWILKLAFNSVLGGILIFIINLIGGILMILMGLLLIFKPEWIMFNFEVML